jgi:hypothetical protein
MPGALARGKIAASQPGLTLVLGVEDGRRAILGVGCRPERAAAVADHMADIVPDQGRTRHTPIPAPAIGAEEIDAVFRSDKDKNIDRCSLRHVAWIPQHQLSRPVRVYVHSRTSVPK